MHRRIWKWIAILQTYDVTITHIPGSRNPTDALTRKVWIEDQQMAKQVHQLDKDLVDQIRVSKDASDQDIQRALDRVFKTKSVGEQAVDD